MPAAGKCRKGVLIMKKLLLVALVPILVLGFMGCGGTEEGDPLPYFAQGAYHGIDADNNNIYFVLTASQLTVLRKDAETGETLGTSAFRTGFAEGSGDNGKISLDTLSIAAAATTTPENATLSLFGFSAKGEVGTIKFRLINRDLIVQDVWFDGNVQTFQLPVKGTYGRTDLGDTE
jgi:hypothetical protein